jgi:hypothetical protein
MMLSDPETLKQKIMLQFVLILVVVDDALWLNDLHTELFGLGMS